LLTIKATICGIGRRKIKIAITGHSGRILQKTITGCETTDRARSGRYSGTNVGMKWGRELMD